MFKQDTAVGWKFVHDGRVYGPVSTEKVQDLCRTGFIQPQTHIASALFPGWAEASSVEALRAAMSQSTDAGGAGVLEGVPSIICMTPPGRSDGLFCGLSWGMSILLLLASIGIGLIAWRMHYPSADDPFGDVTRQTSLILGASAATVVLTRGFLVGWVVSLVGQLFPNERRRAVSRAAFACGASSIVLLALSMLIQAHKMNPSPRGDSAAQVGRDHAGR